VVNSVHHQAVARVAPGFDVDARASDGVVEAISMRGPSWVRGVQWHPEFVDPAGPGHADALALLRSFEEAARIRRAQG
jgi:putative glutamine amidotransferase